MGRYIEQKGHDNDGWMSLLVNLRQITMAVIHCNPTQIPQSLTEAWPCVRLTHRSWDSVPTDITRSYATVELSDLVILANRLGMSWKVFEPYKGRLFAESRSQVLSSVNVPGLGLAVSYKSESWVRKLPMHKAAKGLWPGHETQNMVLHRLWDWRMEMLIFGIVYGQAPFRPGDFAIDTRESMVQTMNETLHLSAFGDWTFIFQEVAAGLYGMMELVALASPMYRKAGMEGPLSSLVWEHGRVFSNPVGYLWSSGIWFKPV